MKGKVIAVKGSYLMVETGESVVWVKCRIKLSQELVGQKITIRFDERTNKYVW